MIHDSESCGTDTAPATFVLLLGSNRNKKIQGRLHFIGADDNLLCLERAWVWLAKVFHM